MKNLLNREDNKFEEEIDNKEIYEFIEKLYSQSIDEKIKVEENISETKDWIRRFTGELEYRIKELNENEPFLSPMHNQEREQLRIKELENNISFFQKNLENLTERRENLNSVINEIYKMFQKADTEAAHNSDRHEQQLYKLKILQTQEMERQRIARDLHDTTVQNLTNIVHRSELALKLLDLDSIRAKLEMTAIIKNVRNIIKDMRGIIYNLRPMSFDDMGIHITIERELEKLKLQGINKIVYNVEGKEENVDSIVSLTLLRIVQEACNNIIKYSKTNEAEFRFVYNDTTVELYIEDKGIGFDLDAITGPTNIENPSGFGLSMMSERVYLLSGTIRVTTEKGKGTSIYVKVPKNYKEE